MAYYQNYEKMETKRNRFESTGGYVESDYEPIDNNTVKTDTRAQNISFLNNIEKYKDFVSWARWYPDLLLDLIKPKSRRGKSSFRPKSVSKSYYEISKCLWGFPSWLGKMRRKRYLYFYDKRNDES